MADRAASTMPDDAPGKSRPRPVVLCILDGWGHREESDGNAIALAETPNYDEMWNTCPTAMVDTGGASVGLPEGQMGNSEVGHMNIGAGRVMLQDLPRIDRAFREGALDQNQAFQDLITALKRSGGACHIMGLLSPGGVHSHQNHISHLGIALATAGIPVIFHAFLDGRDTPPQSALEYLSKFQAQIADFPSCRVGTVSGRYYAMDRDRRWDRVAVACGALVAGNGIPAEKAEDAIQGAYARGETDEFVMPTVIGGYTGMVDGDAILMANFRADRAREILTALVDPQFDEFEFSTRPALSAAVGMVQYSSELDRFMGSLFPAIGVEDGLGQTVANAGLRQLRIAETEKYAHVTFFLNGGEEKPFPGEDRILVPSPKVATYDLQPEMSAPEVTDKLVAAISSGTYDLIVANYANPDMVGHTGIMEAAISAVETIDLCLGRLDEAVKDARGVMLLTADHGNIEQMTDAKSGQPHTAHTVGKVPLLILNADTPLQDGRLADVAPTILAIMGLDKPAVMTGHSLLLRETAITSEASNAQHIA